MIKVLILGIDGYIGWPLANHLLNQSNKYKVAGLDNGVRRKRVMECGSKSLTLIHDRISREEYITSHVNFFNSIYNCNINDTYLISKFLKDFQPDAIIHLAEQPSAPYSMKDSYASIMTQSENILGTLSLLWAIHKECPNAHLIKLGTMGEYGTPNCDIPEGRIPPSPCNYTQGNGYLSDLGTCPMSGLLFPRTAGSFYHLSKVHDTHNIEFACRNWGLRSTDVMQGVVYGLYPYSPSNPALLTRFDYDQYFGTVINRFIAQALVNMPLTVYGLGQQVRGFLTLEDSIKCLNIAIDNPPKPGKYRTFNQFEHIYSINKLANAVVDAAAELEITATIQHIENPRESIESHNHYYNPDNSKLLNLGYVPNTNMHGELIKLFNSLIPRKDHILTNVILPTTNWR